MKATALTLCLAAAPFALAEPLWATRKQPFEIQAIRYAETGECDVITFRQTQIVKGLDFGEAYVTSLQTATGDERLSIISYEEEALQARFYSLCIHNKWEGNTNELYREGEQEILSPKIPSARQAVVSSSYPPLEVLPLNVSGPSSNRVDLVFFSDGYLAEEKAKFLEDAKRLADDISNNHTFNTVKPLMNFWAAFTRSNESGIGTGGRTKDTPFGLYRDGTELRGVYYSKPAVARAACLALGSQCDFPILVGNDPLYGGLGGEFTVITPSLANGALVLRHELGHSVIDVGEEYDGGYDYFGVNALQKLHGPVPWKHWLTDPKSVLHHHHPRVERSVMPMQAYPWTLLNISTPWSINFTASGMYARHLVRFSLSGLPDEADLAVELDGEDLGWTPRKDIGVDRWHYDIHRDGGLSDGEHEVKFILKNWALEGVAQLCSVEILEFGTEEEFHSKPGYYGLYPTFSDANLTTYRPTNEDCLMRIVTTPDFCNACMEGLWLSLLKRVDLIDDVVAGCAQNHWTKNWYRLLEVQWVPLAHWYGNPNAPYGYTVEWFKNGEKLHFPDLSRISLGDADAPGVYTVKVKYRTPQVLVDKEHLLSSEATITVSDYCRPTSTGLM